MLRTVPKHGEFSINDSCYYYYYHDYYYSYYQESSYTYAESRVPNKYLLNKIEYNELINIDNYLTSTPECSQESDVSFQPEPVGTR